MSLSDKELAFIEKNIVLEEVNGEIVIEVIRTDVGRVDGKVSWVYGHVGRAVSVDRIGRVDGRVGGRVDRAGGVGRVLDRIDARVRLAESAGRIGNEESES